MQDKRTRAVAATMFLLSFGLVLFELALTRIFGVVLFASFAHLALALALMGITVGALAQHLWPSLVPDEGLEERLGWITLTQGATTVMAIIASIVMPVTVQFEQAPSDFGERSSVVWNLVDPVWFALLLPVLMTPFAVAGLAFAGVFQRRKADISLLYGADLMGGAAAAVAFVPLLYVMAGPDTVFVVAFTGCLAAVMLFWVSGNQATAKASLVPAVLCLVLSGISMTGREIIPVKTAAGYSEDNVIATRWTPLTRLAVHINERGTYMLLDNSSASEIIRTKERRAQKAKEPNRSLVYRLFEPGAEIAVLAASAGPEVAVAQHFGHYGIEAVDIAPEIGDMVAEMYPKSPVNPYTHGDTKRVLLDGRAAILHSDHQYDIIQMVHANLHSSAGQLANAWSPALLETKEAFGLYFSKLKPNGMLSFGRGGSTRKLIRSMAEALRDRGVNDPERYLLWIQGPAQVVLAKNTPFTSEEVRRIDKLVKERKGQYIYMDPTNPMPERVASRLNTNRVLTDDRPYLETPGEVLLGLKDAAAHFMGRGSGEVAAVAVIYHTLVIQSAFVLFIGLLCVVVPAMRKSPTGLVGVRGVAYGLAYVACLGYGYLAVETILVHELILFVGHPTYAITIVILAMLAFSGLGSLTVNRWTPEQLPRVLKGVLLVVVALGALQAFVVPPVLHATALGLPIAMRVAITFVVLAPLGFVMGMPFPTAMRILRPEAAGMVPWAWALNGWMSVVASLATVIISRMFGYSAAYLVALAAYLCALALAGTLAGIGPANTERV